MSSALVAALSVALVACTGGAAGVSPSPSLSPSSNVATTPSAIPTTPPPPTPDASPSPSTPATEPPTTEARGPVDTAEEALAAVIEGFPEFTDHALEVPGGEIMIGGSSSVTARQDDDGFRLIFMTGAGDCMAGCINRQYDVFLVAHNGTVTEECSWREEGGEVVSGTPCVELAPGGF